MKIFLGKNCHHMVGQAGWPSYYVSDLQSWLVGKNIICLKMDISPPSQGCWLGQTRKGMFSAESSVNLAHGPLLPTLCCNHIMISSGAGLPLSASPSTTALVISGCRKRILSTGSLQHIFPTALEPGSKGLGFGLVLGEGSLPGL